MPKYKIAWLPGDGVGVDVLEAAEIDQIVIGSCYLCSPAAAAASAITGVLTDRRNGGQ